MVNYAGSFFETLSYLWDICALFVALLVFLVCQLRVKTNRFSRTSRQLSFEREDFIRKYQRRERDVRRHQESKKAKLSKEKKKKQSASRHKRKEKEGAGLKDKGVLGHEERVREKRSSLNTAGAFTLAPLNDDQTQKKKKRKKKKKSTMG
jgi:biopolymer transport protein ExbB/TolQ